MLYFGNQKINIPQKTVKTPFTNSNAVTVVRNTNAISGQGNYGLRVENVDYATQKSNITKTNLFTDAQRTMALDQNLSKSDHFYYENAFKWPSNTIDQLNEYKFIYNEAWGEDDGNIVVHQGNTASKDNMGVSRVRIESVATPSLFNPNYAVHAIGVVENIPLLVNTPERNVKANVTNVDDKNNVTKTTVAGRIGNVNKYTTTCTINELVRLSDHQAKGIGKARYSYADFMYCKDLGKVSNNHLITLRRFSSPVGDNIFKHMSSGEFEILNDIGRLVTWFGTPDNKLEDIVKYDYSMSWRPYQAKIEEQDAQENQGPLGNLLNSINPAYNKAAAKGFGGSNNALASLGSKLNTDIPLFGSTNFGGVGQYQNHQCLTNYDKNKVYEPKNTIQDNSIYEGKLQSNHELTIKFCYHLRSYNNINPKAAFLDLLGNILVVTYQKGHYWGGARKLNGPPQNTAGWKKANALIDGAFDKLDGLIGGLASGQLDMGSILSSIGQWASKMWDNVKNAWNGVVNTVKEGGVAKTVASGFQSLNSRFGIIDGLKGQLKNGLGRPAIYCWDSIIGGGDVGMWHLTIGNPKNPIIVMGNLIMTKADIKHSGALGLDDFPTDLTVTVSLKQARSRDATEIQRMYTKGASSIYLNNTSKQISKFTKVSVRESDKTSFSYKVYDENAKGYLRDEVAKAPNGTFTIDDIMAFQNQSIDAQIKAQEKAQQVAEAKAKAEEKAKAAKEKAEKEKAENATSSSDGSSTSKPSTEKPTESEEEKAEKAKAKAAEEQKKQQERDLQVYIDESISDNDISKLNNYVDTSIYTLPSLNEIYKQQQGGEYVEYDISDYPELTNNVLMRRHIGIIDDPMQIPCMLADGGVFG